MSYFGQVRSASLDFLSRSAAYTRSPGPDPSSSASSTKDTRRETLSDDGHGCEPPGMNRVQEDATAELPLLSHETLEPVNDAVHPDHNTSSLNPYPTPPRSQTSSEKGVILDTAGVASGAENGPRRAVRPVSAHVKRLSDLSLKVRRASLSTPLTSIVTPSTVLASHLSNPSSRTTHTTPSTPLSMPSSAADASGYFAQSASVDQLKRLTDVAWKKSGQSTPTRAMSTTQPAPAESRSSSKTSDGDANAASGRATPVSSQTGGAAAPTQKGKMTIKIIEARGIRRARDPYVVAVFQRSELISAGPQPPAEEDDVPQSATTSAGVPIQRQISDSGRPMAIPMRSRQSSNTSVNDHNTFRNRNGLRSFTNPKWDAEAVL